jgi:hypothetical protein
MLVGTPIAVLSIQTIVERFPIVAYDRASGIFPSQNSLQPLGSDHGVRFSAFRILGITDGRPLIVEKSAKELRAIQIWKRASSRNFLEEVPYNGRPSRVETVWNGMTPMPRMLHRGWVGLSWARLSPRPRSNTRSTPSAIAIRSKHGLPRISAFRESARVEAG